MSWKIAASHLLRLTFLSRKAIYRFCRACYEGILRRLPLIPHASVYLRVTLIHKRKTPEPQVI
jgi:hypothetical protein